MDKFVDFECDLSYMEAIRIMNEEYSNYHIIHVLAYGHNYVHLLLELDMEGSL